MADLTASTDHLIMRIKECTDKRLYDANLAGYYDNDVDNYHCALCDAAFTELARRAGRRWDR